MRKVAIFGRGFGLYGYLPALSQIQDTKIILPSTYQEILKSRNDICEFYNIIKWEDSEEVILETCDCVVIALPPKQQNFFVKKCFEHNNIKHIFLEKPLSFSPNSAKKLLSALKFCGKKFHIGYNFRYTNWGKDLLNNPQNLKNISWNFCANHYQKNLKTWKRKHNLGGGALRFYGIHLIALLAEIGYSKTSFSKMQSSQKNEVESWEAEFIGDNLKPCQISINSKSNKTNFIISKIDEETISLNNPFQSSPVSIDSSKDQRIPYLKSGILDLFNNETNNLKLYYKVNSLWQNIEQKSLC